MKPTYKDLHAAADVFWQRAWQKTRFNITPSVKSEALELQTAAYELQKMAAMQAMNQMIEEPYLSIVVGSAANMALILGKNMEAAIAAEFVLQGAPPPEIKKDMKAILEKLPETHQDLKQIKSGLHLRRN